MKFLRPVLLLVLAALFTGLFSACGGDESAGQENAGVEVEANGDADRKTLRFGSLFATHGAGEAFGPQQLAAAQLAVDEINGAGGIDGAEVELVQADGDGDPAEAVTLANDLIDDDDVLAILGATFSNTSNHVHPLADEFGVPMLAVSNTSTGIVGNCAYPCQLVFRNSLGEETAIPANIESYLDRLGAKKKPRTAVVIHPDDDPFGEASAAIAEQAFADAGLPDTQIFHGDKAVERTAKLKPEVVMITASSGEVAAQLVRRLRKAGYRGDILGGNAFNSPLTGKLMGKAGAGIQVAAAWFAGNPAAENRDFVAAYRGANGTPPDQFAAQAYSGIQLLAAAAEEADLSFSDLAADRLAFADALAEIEVDTPLGTISFTAEHDISQPIWIVETNGRGGFRLIEEK